MEPIFLEIIFVVDDLLANGFEDRDEIEDELATALAESGLGEITGGGAGMGKAVIDVEIDANVNLEDARAFLRKLLRRLRAPSTTIIKCYVPNEQVFPVY
jgi:hypothetical protein